MQKNSQKWIKIQIPRAGVGKREGECKNTPPKRGIFAQNKHPIAERKSIWKMEKIVAASTDFFDCALRLHLWVTVIMMRTNTSTAEGFSNPHSKSLQSLPTYWPPQGSRIVWPTPLEQL